VANRYWVGGGSSENWNATGPTNWSGTSGGSNDATVPGTTDNVFFDDNSGVGNSVISANITIESLDCEGYTGTLTHNNGVNLTVGHLTVGSVVREIIFTTEMTYTLIGTPTLTITGYGTFTLTTGGKTLPNVNTGSDARFAISLNDDLTCGTFVPPQVLIHNGYSVNAQSFVAHSSGSFILNSANGTPIYNAATPIYGGTAGSGEANQQIAQSFLASSDSIKGVLLNLSKVGSPTDNLSVEICDTVDGTALTSVSIDASSVGSFSWRYLKLSSPLSVIPTDKYFIRISRSGSRDETNCIAWSFYSSFSTLAGVGATVRSNNTWGTESALDTVFFVNYESTTADIELSGSGSVFDIKSTTASLDPDINIKLINNSASVKTFTGNGISYQRLWNATQGTGTLTITGSNTFDELRIDAGRTTLFNNGTTQTITTLDIGDGSILRSSSNGNTYTLSIPSGTIRVDNATIRDSIATGGATFKAYTSINEGNNTGWVFIEPPTVVTSSPQTIVTYNALGLANITDDAGYTPIRRGFVWSTTSYGDPGNIEPSASSYPNVTEESGTFTEGTFTRSLFSLDRFVTYYYRGFAEHSEGVIGYGNEVAFTTVKNGLDVNNNALSTATPTNQTTTAQTPSQPSVTTVSPATETTTASAIINEPTNTVTINGT
jgi:hypothetical protein